MSIEGKWLLLIPLLICSCALTPSSLQGLRLYDKSRDDKAQGAEKLLGDLESGSLFEKQAKNVSLLARQDFARYFLHAKTEMRAKIDALETWGDVEQVVQGIGDNLSAPPTISPGELQKKFDELKTKIEEAQKAADRLKTKVEGRVPPSCG